MHLKPSLLALFTAITICLLATGTAGAADTIEGPGIAIQDAESNSKYSQIVDHVEEETGYTQYSAYYVFGQDGTEYLVFGDLGTHSGYVTARNPISISVPGIDVAVVYTEDISVDTTATPVDLDRLQANPEKYTDNVYAVTGHYRQVSTRFDPTEHDYGSRYDAVGTFEESFVNSSDTINAGATVAVDSALATNQSAMHRSLPDSRLVALNTDENTYWIDGKATVDGMVVNADRGLPDFLKGGGLYQIEDGYIYIVTDVEPVAEKTVTPRNVTNGNIEPGTRVTVTGPGTVHFISIRKALVRAAPCGPPKTIVFPPTACLPLLHDTSVVAGAVGTSPLNTTLFIGLNNRVESGILPMWSQRIQVTGEVVRPGRAGTNLPMVGIIRVESITPLNDSITPDKAMRERALVLPIQTMERLEKYNPEQSSLSNPVRLPLQDIKITSAKFDRRYGSTGTHVKISVEVKNVGDAAGKRTIPFRANGSIFDRRVVHLDPGENDTIISLYDIQANETTRFSVADQDIGRAGYAPEQNTDGGTSPRESAESTGNDSWLSTLGIDSLWTIVLPVAAAILIVLWTTCGYVVYNHYRD